MAGVGGIVPLVTVIYCETLIVPAFIVKGLHIAGAIVKVVVVV